MLSVSHSHPFRCAALRHFIIIIFRIECSECARYRSHRSVGIPLTLTRSKMLSTAHTVLRCGFEKCSAHKNRWFTFLSLQTFTGILRSTTNLLPEFNHASIFFVPSANHTAADSFKYNFSFWIAHIRKRNGGYFVESKEIFSQTSRCGW